MKIRTIIVDDELWSLKQFKEELGNASGIDLQGVGHLKSRSVILHLNDIFL